MLLVGLSFQRGRQGVDKENTTDANNKVRGWGRGESCSEAVPLKEEKGSARGCKAAGVGLRLSPASRCQIPGGRTQGRQHNKEDRGEVQLSQPPK